MRLDPSVAVTVLARAETAADHDEDFGCGLQGPASRAVREAVRQLVPKIRKLGKARAIQEARELVRWLDETPKWRALCGKAARRGRRMLRKDVVFPDPRALSPRVLHLRRAEEGFDAKVRDWRAAADFVAAIARGASRPELLPIARAEPALGDLYEDLAASGWLAPPREPLDVAPGSLLFVGHNAVLVAGKKARVLVDPWFRPAHPKERADYRPIQASDLGPVDAIAITHSHGDHFHLGSLLAFDRRTKIVVPAVSRESLLSTDLAARLASIGFENVVRLPWWKSVTVGDVTIEALPFYGEQPHGGEPLYEGLWNEGNTYVVRTGGVSAAFFADAGRDVRGDMMDVARRVRRKARVDFLFTGIRGFRLFPVFYPFTTVDAFLANVPLEAVGEPQQLMSDAPAALDLGDALGARWVVPYADGGAPWYWREGMGPYYEGFDSFPGYKPPPPSPADDPDSDPFPERLEEERERRGKGPAALILRPGDGVRVKARKPELHRYEGFAWPFG